MKSKSLDGTEHIYFYLKDEECGWMSNFYPSPIKPDGIYYPTVEHYYQAHKTSHLDIQMWIADAPKPYLAMTIGRRLRDKDGFHSNWEDIKVDVMLNGLREKFRIHKDLRDKLLATGDAKIHEYSPTDKFWGIRGKDMLGKCLEFVREEIRRGQI